MTNEELETLMKLIVEGQERTNALQERNARQIEVLLQLQATDNAKLQQHDERIERFERSYSAISDLLQRYDSQLVTLTDNANHTNEVITSIAETQSQHDERIKRFERSYTVISDLLQRHDSQLVTLTDNANKTNEIVAGLATSLIKTREVVAGLAVRIANTNATVDRLSVTVERYIAALDNGSNGSKG